MWGSFIMYNFLLFYFSDQILPFQFFELDEGQRYPKNTGETEKLTGNNLKRMTRWEWIKCLQTPWYFSYPPICLSPSLTCPPPVTWLTSTITLYPQSLYFYSLWPVRSPNSNMHVKCVITSLTRVMRYTLSSVGLFLLSLARHPVFPSPLHACEMCRCVEDYVTRTHHPPSL